MDPRDRIRLCAAEWLPEVSQLRLAGIGGYIIQELEKEGYFVVGTGAKEPRPRPKPPACALGHRIESCPNWNEALCVCNDAQAGKAGLEPTT